MHETTPLLSQPQRRWPTISTLLTLLTAVLASISVVVTLLATTLRERSTLDSDNTKRLSDNSVGRFLHITDMHIDKFYKEGSTTYSQCHRKPPNNMEISGDGHRKTGPYGIAEAKCDSPVKLINATSVHLKSKWGGKVDFVLWTGDSARHDKDMEVPRTFKDIIDSNMIASVALKNAFGNVPIVPNIGNNDVNPHNELPAPGHKKARKTFSELAKVWSDFIPKDQMSTFLYGGYFARDIMKLPSRGLTAISLNTMYWYKANNRVGGCKAKDSPGLAQLAWLRYQFALARKRNHDIILLGHVLPTRNNYRPTCYHGYARTVTQIIPTPSKNPLPEVRAQLFGHSNVDLWTFVGHESKWIQSTNTNDKRLWWEREVDEVSGYFGNLIRNVWSKENYTHLNERSWESMEDDPIVSYTEDSQGNIWPTTISQPTRLPADFVDNVIKEFKRILVKDTINPRMGVTTISPSIIPKYYPSYRMFYYLRKPSSRRIWKHLLPGTIVDYDVYWANITELNKHPEDKSAFFKLLYRFSTTYQISDLSIDSYFVWAEKLVNSKYLRKKFRSLSTLNS